VSIVNSRGLEKGVRTLLLAPKAAGAAAHKTYVMRLKESYGSASLSRSCRDL
jgi:hypothetical protein